MIIFLAKCINPVFASAKDGERTSQLRYYSEGQGIKDRARGIVRRSRLAREVRLMEVEQRKFSNNFGNPWSSKRRHGTPDSLPSVVFQQRFFPRRRRFRAVNERRKLRYAFHRNTANAARTRLERPRGVSRLSN